MSIIHLLAGYPVIGGAVALLAGIALLRWEYLRLEPSGRRIYQAATARRIAIVLAIISFVLIFSRFIDVLAHGGTS